MKEWLSVWREAARWLKTLVAELVKTKCLGYLVLAAASVTVVAGLALFLIDPNIKSPLDGVWSAWATMTHVGFGDVVPVSFFGRLLAAALILFGLALFSLFTAVVSVTLLGGSPELPGLAARRTEAETGRAENAEQRLAEEIARLHARMERLEQQETPAPDAEARFY